MDAVSGATYSSVGIVNEVKDALAPAVTDGELEYDGTQTPAESYPEYNGHQGKYRQGKSGKRGSEERENTI